MLPAAASAAAAAAAASATSRIVFDIAEEKYQLFLNSESEIKTSLNMLFKGAYVHPVYLQSARFAAAVPMFQADLEARLAAACFTADIMPGCFRSVDAVFEALSTPAYNTDCNYERLEYLGDGALKGQF